MTHKVRDLRIVLLGKTGSGKSATGNTILGKKAFEVVDFMKSDNKLCEKQEGVVGRKYISIIDTPGLFNTAIGKHQLKAEIEMCVEMSSPGPHVFLLVLKLGVRFTKEERDAVKWFEENFGEEALRRTIILFTHADLLKGKPVDEYISKSNYLMEIVHSCDGRYHSFNNEDRNNQVQVTELLKKIDAMMEENEMSHYTLEMFKTTQKKRKGKKAVIACAVAVIGIVVLGKRKIPGMIVTAISGRATAESAVASTGECTEKAVEVFLKTLAAAGDEVAKKASAAIEKAITAAGDESSKKASAAIEKAITAAGDESSKKASAAIEKAVAAAGEAAAKNAVAAIEKAIANAAEAAVGKTVAGVATQGAGVAGVATQAAIGVAVAAAVAAAAAARSAGKVVTSGRVSLVAALAAAFGATAVTLISALKP